jgi:hypothetical protein
MSKADYGRRLNGDGTFSAVPMLSKADWDALVKAPMSDWARKIGTHQITVNSDARVVYRGAERRQMAQKARIK